MSAKKVSLPSNHVELYVKSGWDGQSYGACPFCQRFYMILDLKAQEGTLTFKVITVNPARPTADVKSYAHKLPVLKHGDEVIMDSDEMVQYIDDNFPYPDLRYTNRKAHTVCLDVFSKFNFFIKNVSTLREPLLKELHQIDSFMKTAGTNFLCGDELTHLDCLMLPKLHHARVASEAFKDFEIPSNMTGLLHLLRSAYSNETFRKTCPSDQEIVHHWSTKGETTPLPKSKQRFYMLEGTPVYSMDVGQANGNGCTVL
ncbi:LOW QUALITY PROTEIN: chloride intracellular channel protein 1-like [Haliotis rubra]|uniref:LOW QUALITY PROTEIN: chloride intracellular channel protein 1-like n=1 Tax=Haliotis rubra TaxID=36100 RepID=UPI001EE57FFC|nr:LOW QUALITY PROTEIN: chloride intracellular channel protein 1-like [Haliotis rubra]